MPVTLFRNLDNLMALLLAFQSMMDEKKQKNKH